MSKIRTGSKKWFEAMHAQSREASRGMGVVPSRSKSKGWIQDDDVMPERIAWIVFVVVIVVWALIAK